MVLVQEWANRPMEQNEELEIDTVIAKGNVLMKNKKVLIKGTYEK